MSTCVRSSPLVTASRPRDARCAQVEGIETAQDAPPVAPLPGGHTFKVFLVQVRRQRACTRQLLSTPA